MRKERFANQLFLKVINTKQVLALLALCAGTTLSQIPSDLASLLSSLQLVSLVWGSLYALLSGASGVFTEKLLRGGKESLALQQLQLYFWGVVSNVVVVFYYRGYKPPHDWGHYLIVGMISAQVLSGLFTAWLLRFQGSYARVFLHSLVGMCVGVYGLLFWNEPITLNQIVGIAINVASIYFFYQFESPSFVSKKSKKKKPLRYTPQLGQKIKK